MLLFVEEEPLGCLEEVRAIVLGEITSAECFFSGLDEEDVVEDENDGGGAMGMDGVGDGVATVDDLDC